MASENHDNKFKNIDIQKMLEFVKKNARYFVAGALFVVILLILVKFTGDNTNQANDGTVVATETVVTEEKYEENAIPAVNELINNYFTAYASGDLVTLQTLATPITQNEQSYITLISQYIEQYQDINCYTKSGLDSNSYMVNVSLNVKFMGVDTPAPGLYFFYVRTNEDGSLYIDNLYSEYNLSRQESALDTSVRNLITNFYNSDDVIELQNDIQQKYEAALSTDENLLNLCATTIPNAITEWRNTIVADATESTEKVPATEEVPTTEAPTEETPTDETPAEETPAEQTSETVYTTDKVNVRAGADTSSDKLGSVEKGTSLTRTGTDGDWSIIDYNGTTGYIKSEYLSATAPESTSEGTAAASGLTEGTEITLSNTTNIRSSMSETADKVGVAYSGEKVTVVMSYAEGWTKVTWKNKTGYIKTDLLK